MIRSVTVVVLLSILGSVGAAAQGTCTEQFINGQVANEDPKALADDLFFFSGALDKPVVGVEAVKRASAPVGEARKNEKQTPLNPERIVAAASGDMAYEYGSTHLSFDVRETGKHMEFTAAYLRVWKEVDGSCKIAAEMFEPER